MKLPTFLGKVFRMFGGNERQTASSASPPRSGVVPRSAVSMPARDAGLARSSHVRQELLDKILLTRSAEERALHANIEAIINAHSMPAPDAAIVAAPPALPVSQRLIELPAAPATVTVFHLLNVNAPALVGSLEATHQSKNISGAGAKCAWRSAWTAVMLTMTPEQLHDAIINTLGNAHASKAIQMREACAAVERNGILSIFNDKNLQGNSQLHVPGFVSERGEELLDELTYLFLRKGGASDDKATALVYREQFAEADDVMKLFRPLGVIAAVLETRQEPVADSPGREIMAATLTVCATHAMRIPDPEDSAGTMETRTGVLKGLLADMPVLRISGSHFTVQIPNKDLPGGPR
ncbi:hypothetical protein QN362_13225 [Actimicrobium sp. CCC2.4]|uniref:hypothetical protein n=1 Tax=Actimicrobium sp. CCC2.4 TaxID=3048606 RepID=UPI002AC96B9A|nr:hypothetical protein [Actimicrobium sp. CCC2.4]MEB0136297.1 hypothetical protein [Actimicrobium sp. CCC2.4]WPX33638.1 hypothetical protein RHM62_07380 [Actimicrobium sp. CCC2.4]